MTRGPQSTERIRFGEFDLDLQAGELRRGGIRLKLQGQPIRVLQLMLERPGEVVTQEELRSALWAENTFVDFDHGLRAAVARLRAALADHPDSPRIVETVPRKGYRYVGPAPLRVALASVESPPAVAPARRLAAVRAWAGRSAWTRVMALAAALLAVLLLWGTLREGRLQARSGKRVVAVLPLRAAGPDSQGEAFRKGLTEELIQQLAQIDPRRVGVIASSESSKFQGVTEITYALRLDCVVEGTVRREADHVRVTARLIRIQDRTHLWAESFDGQLSGDLDTQKQMAAQIAASLQRKLVVTY